MKKVKVFVEFEVDADSPGLAVSAIYNHVIQMKTNKQIRCRQITTDERAKEGASLDIDYTMMEDKDDDK